MRLRVVFFSLLVLAVVASPAMAADLYDNGPINGQVDAWTINFGFTVTNSMQVNGTVTGLDFGAFLIPGDTVTSVEVSISGSPFGRDLFDEVVSTTQSNCFSNQYGYNICNESASFSGPTLNGNYWLTLQNATVPSGDPVYWDENSGVGCLSPGCPSQAQENTVGTIPSESFTLEGTPGTTTTSTSTGTTPEPSSILLLGSGVLGILGVMRRRNE
ncbi:MAG: PEP-CTERM sorting domain-containing protein [Candidatus Korobacteraceae bacterium]